MNSSRRRITGKLDHCPRGLAITTGAGDLWVLEHDDMEADLIGQLVTAEGVTIGYDRLRVEWIGEAQR
jgi:hypothetical protein